MVLRMSYTSSFCSTLGIAFRLGISLGHFKHLAISKMCGLARLELLLVVAFRLFVDSVGASTW